MIGEAEVASLEAEGAKKMLLKENVWKPSQKVLIFTGGNAEDAAAARSDTREKWMDLLQEWFDLEEIPGGLRAY